MDERAEKLLQEKLKERLQKMLPHASEASRQSFIEAVLKPEAVSPLPFEQLLQEYCTPQELYLALVYCRYAISMLYNTLPDTDSAVLSKNLLVQHDKHTTLLLATMESRYEQRWKEIQSKLQQEGRDHLLSQARNEWTNEKEMYIYNLYHEMPVSTVVEILKVGEHSVTLNKTKELIAVIAASEAGNCAFTKLPKTEMSVELIVEETTGKTVHFQFGEFKPLQSERRREMRVQSVKPDPIKVKSAKGDVLQGKLLDYSVSGFGLSFNSETTFQVGEEITFETRINDHKFSGKGTLVWLQKMPGFCRVGMVLDYSQEIHLRLGNEVRRREKAIRSELRLRGVPNSLLSS